MFVVLRVRESLIGFRPKYDIYVDDRYAETKNRQSISVADARLYAGIQLYIDDISAGLSSTATQDCLQSLDSVLPVFTRRLDCGKEMAGGCCHRKRRTRLLAGRHCLRASAS